MEFIAGLAQQQALSPQMQQSLQLLQTPVAELRQLVASEMASNPVLEEMGPSSMTADPQEIPDVQDEANRRDLRISSLQEEWREYMPQSGSVSSGSFSSEDEERRRFLFDSQTSRPTLREAVISQAAGYPESELIIVEAIAGNLDHDGYLRISPDDLASSIPVLPNQLEKVLEKVRQFEPAGVAAHDLADCLCLQLARRGEGNGLAARILKHHLDQLARHRFDEIARAIRVPLDDVAAAARRELVGAPALGVAADAPG